MGKCCFKSLGHARKRPCDKSNTELPVLNVRQLLAQVGLAIENPGIATTKNPNPPGFGDGFHKPATGNQRHRSAYDGIPNTERFR